MEINIILRAARAEEREELGALKLRASLAWGDLVDQLRALPEARDLAQALLPVSFVAEAGGVPVGFAAVTTVEHGLSELEELFVDPPWQRRGVGRRLVEEAIRRSSAAGSKTLHVVSNRRAGAFYEASGFELVAEVMTRFELALSMRRRLG